MVSIGMRTGLKRLFRISNPPAGPLSPQKRSKGWSRRVRMMMRHTWLLCIATLLMCAGIAGIVYFFLSQPETLRFAVGPPSSEDTKVVQAIAGQLARDRANIRLRINVLAGPAAAAAAVDKNEADFAVIRRDVGMPRDGQAVAILRKNVVVFIVPSPAPPAAAAKTGTAAKTGAAAKTAAAKAKARAAAPKPKDAVEKIGGLVGRRLGVVGRSQNNIDLLKAILRQYNIGPEKIAMLTPDDFAKPNDPAKINVVQLDTSNVSSAIRDSNPDVIMAVGPVSSTITADAIAAATRGKEPPTFLAIDAAEAIAERNPVYESSEIKAGAFGGSPPRPEESVDTIEVNHYIVARRNLAEDTVADFTKQLFAIRQTLASEITAAAKIEKPDTDKDAAVPVHPGAAAYLDGELKSFFDRYNDLLYWGLMVFSFFGSALAGLLSYTKADDRVTKLRGLDRLVEIISAARVAETMQVLDELLGELDAIHASMVRQVEDNTLDDTAIMAFAVSFEQARIAISDRRVALHDQPSRPLAAVASL